MKITKSKLDKMGLTYHARERLKQRYNKMGDKALAYARDIVANGVYVTAYVNDKGNRVHLFAKNKNVVVLGDDMSVVTVFQNDKPKMNTVKSSVDQYIKYLKGKNYRIKRKIKDVRQYIYELEEEILKTRSRSKMYAIMAHIEAMKIHIKDLEEEILNNHAEMKRSAITLAAVV